jgi:hypothetical protein
MKPIVVTRFINATPETVFQTVANIREFQKALPHATGVEFLSDQQSGVGARFRETRILRGQEAITELEITEHVENERVRMVNDNPGTVWDTTFAVSRDGGKAILTTTMHAVARKLLPRLMNPLIRGMVAKAVETDMDLVKAYCEKQAVPGRQ